MKSAAFEVDAPECSPVFRPEFAAGVRSAIEFLLDWILSRDCLASLFFRAVSWGIALSRFFLEAILFSGNNRLASELFS